VALVAHGPAPGLAFPADDTRRSAEGGDVATFTVWKFHTADGAELIHTDLSDEDEDAPRKAFSEED